MDRDKINDLSGVGLRQNKTSPPLESGVRPGVKKPEAFYPGGPPPLYMQQYGLTSASFPHYAGHQAAAAAEMLLKNSLTQFRNPYHAAAHPPGKEERHAAAQERERHDRSARERRDLDMRERERLEKERQEQAVHLHFEESLRLAQQKLGGASSKPAAAAAKHSSSRGSAAAAAVEKEKERERYLAAMDQRERHLQQLRTPITAPTTTGSSSPYSALPRADLNFSSMSYQGARKPDEVKSGVIVGPGQVTFKPYERQPVVSRSSRTPPGLGYPIHYTGPGPGSGQHSPSLSRGLQQPGYNMPPPSVSPSRSPGHLGPPIGYPSMYSAALAPVQSTSPLQGGSKGKAGSASPAPGHLAAPPNTAASTSYGRPVSALSVNAGITTGIPLRRPSPEQAQQTAPLSLTTTGKVPSSTQGSSPSHHDNELKSNSAFTPLNPSRKSYVQQQPVDLVRRDEAPISLVSSSKSTEVSVKTKTDIPVAFPGLGSQPMMSVAALIDAANAVAAQGKSNDSAAFVLGLKSSSPVAASPSPVKIEPPSVTAADVKAVKTEPPEPNHPPASPAAPSSTVTIKPVHKLKTAWLQRHAGGDETPVKLSNIPESNPSSPSPAKIARKIAAVSSINGNAAESETPPVHGGGVAAGGAGSTRGRRKRGGGAATLGRRIGTKPRNAAAAAVAAAVAAASSSASGTDSGSDDEEESAVSLKGKRNLREQKTGTGRGTGRQRSSDSGSSSKDFGPQRRGRGSAANRSGSTKNPFNKPPIAQLKKTGESFLQDGACWEVAPRLGKCRECRLTPHQRKRTEQHNANIFCRFYAFRRLRYTKSGQLAIAGFSHPVKDATEEDKKLWLPQPDAAPVDLDVDMSAFLVTHVGDQFCLMVQQERESMSQALSMKGEDGEPVFEEIAWKRVVQGVREMCDVCETTLFNFHWACSKCGYVVCIDCYKSRCASAAAGVQANGINSGNDDEREEKDKERDTYGWLYCTSRSGHDPVKLMPTQIIAGQALETMTHLIHVVRHQWGITQFCDCPHAKQLHQARNQVNGSGTSSGSNGLYKDKLANGNTIRNSLQNGFSGQMDKVTESSDSPLNWLADVALTKGKSPSKVTRNGKDPDLLNGCEMDSDVNSDEEVDNNFSTLRELLIRPSGPGSEESSPAPAAKKPRLNRLETLEDVISCVIERGVNRADASGEAIPVKGESAEETSPVELKYFKRPDVFRTARTREPLPVRIMLMSESAALYPDVPHSWLCNGRLLRLHEPQNPNNYKIFQDQWKRGQPVMISGVHPLLDKNIWHPDSFCRDFGDVKNDLVNCMTGNLVPNQPMRKFWEGFERLTRRLKDEKGQPMLLKLKDWPPGDDFAEVLPTRFADLMKCLPVGEYTKRNGRLNLAGRLPDCFVRPDLGPKMYNAYGAPQFADKGTTNLHLDVSDAANVMVYVGIPKELNAEECMKEALKAIDDGGCDPLTRQRVRESGELPGALWHIYQARDADRIRDFLNKVALERGVRLEPHHDPIHDQSCYLDGPLRARLYQEYGVSGYAIVQCLGDVVFIPAGAPHQVRNLHSCVKVAEDFVSPENVAHCFQLTQEFRVLSDTHTNHEDKLQIKNVIYHAIKDSLSVLTSTRKSPATNPPSADVN